MAGPINEVKTMCSKKLKKLVPEPVEKYWNLVMDKFAEYEKLGEIFLILAFILISLTIIGLSFATFGSELPQHVVSDELGIEGCPPVVDSPDMQDQCFSKMSAAFSSRNLYYRFKFLGDALFPWIAALVAMLMARELWIIRQELEGGEEQ